MSKSNYAVFILTHGRPNKVYTTKALGKAGYTGKIYYILDTDDKTADEYKENFGEENIIIFDKAETLKDFDIMDNQSDYRCIVFARNESFKIAERLGLDYFIELDDDYTQFIYRFDDEYRYIPATRPIKNLDKIFEYMIEYLENTIIDTIAFAQGGDFIGGKSGGMAQVVQSKRKAMNLFVIKTNRKFNFIGRINEDVNTYVSEGSRGRIFLTTTQLALKQKTTQTNSGGMTEMYEAEGTYVKSFYSVMVSPSSVKINLMGNKNKRLHHIISWKNTVPKIIKEDYKKK